MGGRLDWPHGGSGTAAVDSWYSEISNYDFATGKPIDSTKAIGHFTALVWKNTTKLGVGGSLARARNGGRPTSWPTSRRPETWEAST
ncbi:CAP domain-containing protein [Micromonospora sp. M12]